MLGYLDKLNCNLVIETNVRGVKDWWGIFTVQHGTVQYNTVTVQYSTVQYSTVQYSTKTLQEIEGEGARRDRSHWSCMESQTSLKMGVFCT